MDGALSFARRALACKEDTELLALGAQVTSRLKELSQLKWDSQDTEKIERKTIEFKEANKQINAQETDTTVGEIHVRMSTPDIQIIPTELQDRVPFSHSCSITFQVTATVNFKCKTPKLTASATCTALCPLWEQTYYYNCTTDENATVNSWTVTFTPEARNTYTITFQVNGNYGGTALQKSSDFQIVVY